MRGHRVILHLWEARQIYWDITSGLDLVKKGLQPPYWWTRDLELWAAVLIDRVLDPDANPPVEEE
jgi:hypothetical protein